ncbi:MAG: TonB-dependent receptor plug domain-containing protein [bacterium]
MKCLLEQYHNKQFLSSRTLISCKWSFPLPKCLPTLLLAMQMIGCWTGNLHHNNIPMDLTKLSIEELMDLEFVTVFKKPEKLFESQAAVYSITSEDISRSGAMNIPAMLRMVPGLQVGQHDANSWAITARGFSGLSRGISGQFANKLLVLSDGRSLYTPLFSGVSWETQDVLLEDVERIEVIRGPGAALWGANAVNGIINIISKKAHRTQGGLLSLGGGTEQRGFGHFRYGGAIGESSYFRVYTKYLKVDNLVDSTGNKTSDGWHVLRGGFRVDWDKSHDNTVTLQGEIYDGVVGQRHNIIVSPEPPFQQIFDFDTKINGGHVLGRWKHNFSSSSDLALQVYFDRVKREEPVVNGEINTFDVDFQHGFLLGERQELIWGAAYRYISDSFDSTFTFSLQPSHRNVHLFTCFIQDDIALIKNRLRLTLGSKFEHNDYTGFEIQPSLRLSWTPTERQTLWGAISRAVRTPSRGEDDVKLVLEAFSPGTFLVLFGDRSFVSENLVALELGYRLRPTRELTLDVATFYNIYDRLRTDERGFPIFHEVPPPPRIVFPLTVGNLMDGRTYGLEFAVDWHASKRWRIRTAYSYLQMQLDLDQVRTQSTFFKSLEGQSPHHQFFIRSLIDLAKNMEFDIDVRYVDKLPEQDVNSYVNMDFRFGFQISKNLGFSVVGHNLLKNHHPENSQKLIIEGKRIQTGTESSEVQRGFYGKITWQF